MTIPFQADEGRVRNALRQLIQELLEEGVNRAEGDSSNGGTEPKVPRYEHSMPESDLLLIEVRGSRRAVSGLKNALTAGEVMLEIGVGKATGPKYRVFGRGK